MHVLLHSVPPNLKQATADPHLCWRLLDTPRQVWVSLLWSHCSFLLGPGADKILLCPPRVYFPVLCKFWQLYGGVNGDLLQEGLCCTQVCCTQKPCPCGSPLLSCTSTGDTQTQFCLSLCGISGSWCPQGLFEPSEHLWQVWSLILNVILCLLPPFWGFSFVLGCGAFGRNDRERMIAEREYDRCATDLASTFYCRTDDLLMSSVNTVKRSERNADIRIFIF